MTKKQNSQIFPCGETQRDYPSRREFLAKSSLGFGSLALTTMLADQARAANPLADKKPHFAPKAKRVILLFMEGGISQMDTIDYKPELVRLHDEPLPEVALPKIMREGKGEKLSEFGKLYGPVRKFRKHGESGLWISDALPNIAEHADKLCILNGMVCDSTEHGAATQQFHCGMTTLPRPSMGAWLLYGLGTENQNLPGFVVISPPAGTR
jgi:hypothetical protein